MIKCLIVDDEQHAVELLTSYVGKLPDLELAFATTKSITAFQYAQNNLVDLVYLDIHMPELNGIQFLKLLSGKAKVILTTAYPEYALEGYEHDIIDYLLKPILFDRFLKATQKAINQAATSKNIAAYPANLDVEDDYVFVKGDSRSKLVKVRLADVLYIVSLGNYVTFYLRDTKIITLATMKEVEDRLPSSLFIRTHKSYIAAINQIEAVEGNQVFIGKTAVPLSETYKDAFFKSISGKILNPKK